MRTSLIIAALASCVLIAGCNTVRGAGEDARSVGRVFTDHPDGEKK